MGFVVPVLFGLAAAMTVAVIWLGRRLRSFSAALLIGFGVLTVIWSLGEGLRDAHWHNIDGFADCHPSCEFWWDGVWVLFFWGPRCSQSFLSSPCPLPPPDTGVAGAAARRARSAI